MRWSSGKPDSHLYGQFMLRERQRKEFTADRGVSGKSPAGSGYKIVGQLL